MQHSLVSFTERNRDIYEYKNYVSKNTNKAEIHQMKNILSQAIVSELTPRQRDCITLYYYDGMKMKDIALMLSLSPSTVTRHIKASVKKLKNVAKYY